MIVRRHFLAALNDEGPVWRARSSVQRLAKRMLKRVRVELLRAQQAQRLRVDLDFEQEVVAAEVAILLGQQERLGGVVGDQQARAGEVLQVIRKLRDAYDLTMLMVTHEMGFAKEFADRVCFFYEGNIVEQGRPADVPHVHQGNPGCKVPGDSHPFP